jgi:hypothetical protein
MVGTEPGYLKIFIKLTQKKGENFELYLITTSTILGSDAEVC